MPARDAPAVKRYGRSCAACALISLGFIAAACSLFTSVDPVGETAQTPARSAAPSGAGWSAPLKPRREADDAGAPAGACTTPMHVPKVCPSALSAACVSSASACCALMPSADGIGTRRSRSLRVTNIFRTPSTKAN